MPEIAILRRALFAAAMLLLAAALIVALFGCSRGPTNPCRVLWSRGGVDSVGCGR